MFILYQYIYVKMISFCCCFDWNLKGGEVSTHGKGASFLQFWRPPVWIAKMIPDNLQGSRVIIAKEKTPAIKENLKFDAHRNFLLLHFTEAWNSNKKPTENQKCIFVNITIQKRIALVLLRKREAAAAAALLQAALWLFETQCQPRQTFLKSTFATGLDQRITPKNQRGCRPEMKQAPPLPPKKLVWGLHFYCCLQLLYMDVFSTTVCVAAVVCCWHDAEAERRDGDLPTSFSLMFFSCNNGCVQRPGEYKEVPNALCEWICSK